MSTWDGDVKGYQWTFPDDDGNYEKAIKNLRGRNMHKHTEESRFLAGVCLIRRQGELVGIRLPLLFYIGKNVTNTNAHKKYKAGATLAAKESEEVHKWVEGTYKPPAEGEKNVFYKNDPVTVLDQVGSTRKDALEKRKNETVWTSSGGRRPLKDSRTPSGTP